MKKNEKKYEKKYTVKDLREAFGAGEIAGRFDDLTFKEWLKDYTEVEDESKIPEGGVNE